MQRWASCERPLPFGIALPKHKHVPVHKAHAHALAVAEHIGPGTFSHVVVDEVGQRVEPGLPIGPGYGERNLENVLAGREGFGGGLVVRRRILAGDEYLGAHELHVDRARALVEVELEGFRSLGHGAALVYPIALLKVEQLA